jgi:Domain of unknown function (DUF6946)
MTKIVIPTTSADDWQRVLAEPDKQWRSGYSAKALAHCWQSADDFPGSVRAVFESSDFAHFHRLTMLLGIPEHRVPLPGGRRASQTDLFVLAKATNGDLVTITVEGKVAEPFGPLVSEWLVADARGPSAGKLERLAFLCDRLALGEDDCKSVRHQLLHRTASALIEAERFNARHALMLVHSFSETHAWFDDYAGFVRLLGADAAVDSLVRVGERRGVDLYIGWVTGEADFLVM